ncbi:hypothetical protein ES707_17974 [subsurface metagenome]
MRGISIGEYNLKSVDVIRDVIEIWTGEPSGSQTRVRIDQAAWDKICGKVIEDMEKGATPGEEVE